MHTHLPLQTHTDTDADFQVCKFLNVIAHLISSKSHFRETRMVVWPLSRRKEQLTLSGEDRQVVDARISCLHVSIRTELPIFISVRSYPAAFDLVLPLISKSDRDAVALERKELLAQAVLPLFAPFPRQKLHDCISTYNEF